MKVWLNIDNLCVRVQYYCNGQIPKWAKANHVFLIGYPTGKMGSFATWDFQGCLGCTRNKSLFGKANWPVLFGQEYWPRFYLHFSDLPSPQSCWGNPPVLRWIPWSHWVSLWVAKISRQLTWSVFDLNNNNNNNNNNNGINFKNIKICWHSENYLLCSVWILKYTHGTVKWQINWENLHVFGVYQIWS